MGVVSQFYTSFNPKRDSMSKYGNMVQQMVCKLGGNLWVIQNDYSGVVLVGVDSVVNKRERREGFVVSCQMGKFFRRFYCDLEMIQNKDDSAE